MKAVYAFDFYKLCCDESEGYDWHPTVKFHPLLMWQNRIAMPSGDNPQAVVIILAVL